MSVREPASQEHQIAEFEFNAEHRARAEKIIARYPAGRQASAVMPLLDIAQRQAGGWLPVKAMEHVAQMLDMPYICVYEVASFYTMYNLKPVGKYFIQVCRTTPCWLRGSDDITGACKSKLGIDIGGTTEDGAFTLVEVECLGACVNAPMVQINDDYYEDLDADRMSKILDDLKEDKKVRIGSQTGRSCSEPVAG